MWIATTRMHLVKWLYLVSHIILTHSLPQSSSDLAQLSDVSITNTSALINANADNDYIIQYCDEIRTAQLRHILDDLIPSILDLAIPEANLATKSTHGFTALFKRKGLFKNQPLNLLQAIRSRKRLKGLKPNKKFATLPQFACVSPHTQILLNLKHNPYTFCTQERPDSPGIYYFTTWYIILCDTFWLRPLQPSLQPPRANCLPVEGNMFVPPRNLYGYQVYYAMHEMWHFYMGEGGSLSATSVPKEVYSINQCVGLSARDSVRNPTNLQAFVAMVHQDCVEAPDPFLPPWALSANDTVGINGDLAIDGDEAGVEAGDQEPSNGDSATERV